jgi:hypothetical protein
VTDFRMRRQAGTPDERDRGHNQHHESHPNGQERQRLNIWKPVPGADKSRAPQEDEKDRRSRNRQSAQAHDGLGKGLV